MSSFNTQVRTSKEAKTDTGNCVCLCDSRRDKNQFMRLIDAQIYEQLKQQNQFKSISKLIFSELDDLFLRVVGNNCALYIYNGTSWVIVDPTTLTDPKGNPVTYPFLYKGTDICENEQKIINSLSVHSWISVLFRFSCRRSRMGILFHISWFW